MVARPKHPIENVRELQRRLYMAAKRKRERRFHALFEIWRSDALLAAWGTSLSWRRACCVRRPSVSRMREIRTYGLNGDLRKRSLSATAPEVYQ
jgi:hypothetical protein